jgi:capsular polysaccharide biosynthesis protein
MREIRDQVRKSGAGGDSVHDFRQTFGSFEAWEALRDALRQKMSDCADELKIARRTRAEEIRLVHEREEQGVAVELGESGFGPRVTAPAPRR